jgi:hypothetical protein
MIFWVINELAITSEVRRALQLLDQYAREFRADVFESTGEALQDLCAAMALFIDEAVELGQQQQPWNLELLNQRGICVTEATVARLQQIVHQVNQLLAADPQLLLSVISALNLLVGQLSLSLNSMLEVAEILAVADRQEDAATVSTYTQVMVQMVEARASEAQIRNSVCQLVGISPKEA